MISADTFSRNILSWARDDRLTEKHVQHLHHIKRKEGITGMQLVHERTLEEQDYASTLDKLGLERQQAIFGLHAVIVGSGTLAELISAGLAGMGVGSITVMDTAMHYGEPDLLISSISSCKAEAITKEIGLINTDPSARFRWFRSPFSEGLIYGQAPQLVIDATNDPRSKRAIVRYAESNRVPFISASASQNLAAYAAYWPHQGIGGKESPCLERLVLSGFSDERQGVPASCMAAGLILEDARRQLFRYGDSDLGVPSNGIWRYDATDLNLTGKSHRTCPVDYRMRKALVIGCGAIGTTVAMQLGLLGVGRIDVVDMDIVEGSNVTRQLLHRGHYGEDKAAVVRQRLHEINPLVRSTAIKGKVGAVGSEDMGWIQGMAGGKSVAEIVADYFSLSSTEQRAGLRLLNFDEVAGYDALFSCVDSKYARRWISEAAVKARVPAIDGGTGAHFGKVVLYIPFKTSTLDAQLCYSTYPERQSCQIDASTIIPNYIVGAQMVAVAQAVFGNGAPQLDGIFKYDPTRKKKLTVYGRVA
ncbi:MAG: ThiF family adenylyltransferase [Nanoarchaeota archaeon]